LVIEFARNVLNVTDAEHAETSPHAPMQFIERLSCSLVGKTDRVKIVPGTRLASLMRCAECLEQFWCRFGVNPIYAPCLAGGGLTISALDGSGNIRAVELPTHPFFHGTLFIPQLSSTERHPHSVIVGFLRAAAEN
jgi:CTP synthase (UTP-ammonia lyase)